MKRVKVFAALLVAAGLSTAPERAVAQAEIGAQVDLFSSYVWRGLSLTNKPVLQPDLWISFPAGNASVTVGNWANIDLGQYDDPDDDISESGGLSSFNIAELNPYAEVGFPAGKATLTGGIVGYIYPNDLTDESNGGLNTDFNTWEVYAKAELDVLLAPTLQVFYDIDKIDGAYLEASVAHSLPLGEKLTLDLGALAGFSAGQDADLDEFDVPQADFYNFQDNGFTHLDVSAGLPLTAGVFSITPVLHFVVTGDELTKVSSPTELDSDLKLWGGVSIGWAKTLGEAPEEEAEAE
jgi:hypothetical protein